MKIKYRTTTVIIAFILLVCAFYCDKLILGPYATIRIHDTFDTDFPRYAAMGKLLLKNGLFAWYPNIVCGIPSYAFHTPPYYILCLLSMILPLWFLNTFSVMLLMFIAAYGMYWFLKDFLGISTEISFLGGILFSLVTQTYDKAIVHILFNYAFPIFIMFFITAGNKLASFKARSISAVSIIFLMLLSYPVLTMPYFFVLQCLVIVFLTLDNGLSVKRMITKTVLIWGGYIFLSAPILYSLYRYIPFCQRAYARCENIPVSLASLPGYFMTYFSEYAISPYVSLLLIGLAPIIFYSRKARRGLFLLISALFLTLFFLRKPSIFHGTFLEKMDLGHFMFIVPFSVILFVIIEIEEFLKIKAKKAVYAISFIIAGLLLASSMHTPETIRAGLLNITVLLFVFLFCFLSKANARNKRMILPWTIALFIVLLGQFKIERMLKYEFTPYKRFYECHSAFNNLSKEAELSPFRVVTASSFPMVMQSYGLETVETKAPLMPKRYKEFFLEIIRPQLQDKKRSDFFETCWHSLYLLDGEMTPRNDHEQDSAGLFKLPLLLSINTKYAISLYRDPYLDSISEKVIEAKSDNLAGAGTLHEVFDMADKYLGNKSFFQKIASGKIPKMRGGTLFEKFYGTTYFIYQLRDYFDRGYLVPNAVLLDSDSEVLSELSAQSTESLKSNAFFLKGDAVTAKNFQGRRVLSKDDRVDLVHYGPDKLIFKGSITSPRILVITNNYHPNWRAIVNGRREKIYRANHAFQAVFLEKTGSFNVTLLYEDPLLWQTHWLVLFGMILIVFSAFMCTESNEGNVI